MNKFFEGYYFKHQKGGDTIAFIVGISADNAFIQIITNSNSYNIIYDLNEYNQNESIQLGKCNFSKKGIDVDIDDANVSIKGKISYKNLTPLKYDIMGILKYFPMECSHSIISLHHNLTGSITINNKIIDFTDGIGYIEGDRGKSFPKKYMWLQCSDFREKACVTAAIANIPIFSFSITGCICIAYHQGREYRFATYLGVEIVKSDKNSLILKQGKYCLEIFVDPEVGNPLLAPKHGKMSYNIYECTACYGEFRLYKDKNLIFEYKSNNVSFENVE